MEKWNLPILLPKSMEKWRSGETECCDTTSQIYGEKVILIKIFVFLRTFSPAWLAGAGLAGLAGGSLPALTKLKKKEEDLADGHTVSNAPDLF